MNDQGMVVDVDARYLDDSSPFLVFRLSWVAYVREGFMFFVRALVGGMIGAAISLALTASSGKGGSLLTNASTGEWGWVSLLGLGLGVLWSVYAVASTWSVRLFTDEEGVWMFSGVFPWEKGVRGVMWRDVGEAGYTQGFASWLLRSYSIRVSNRFTQDGELFLKNVRYGNLAVEHINGILRAGSGRAPRPR